VVYLLYILFFASCIALVASVLLQPGKTDAGALFTSNISSTAFQPRGAQTILSKITIIAAATFMLSALLLAMPALTGNISVLETVGDSPTTTDANTNVGVMDSNANAASTNTNSAANTIIITNTNELTNNANAATNTSSANASNKIDEPKPAQTEPSNR
jgi:protein translocase SecG subunit